MAKRLLFILFTFFCCSIKAQTVHFSIQAHADDWQLFMSSRVIADMTAGSKMVFITLTAGDQSCGSCSYGGGGPLYLSRENGAIYSSNFAADLTTGTAPLNLPVATTVSITGNSAHNITKYVYKNTVNYFLRLPDGDLSGNGFPNNNNQSLRKLRLGTIPSISTIGINDVPTPLAPTATYTGWSDLTNTIKAIINLEKVTGSQSYIHTANKDITYNVGDHSDHINSGYAAEAAVASGMAWVGINGFMDYNSSAFSSPLLSATDMENASILFGLEVLGMSESQYQNDFNAGHQGWLPIDLFQVIRTPVGNAPLARDMPPERPILLGNGLTEIPMVISVNAFAFIEKDITLSISPYEPGELNTSIYDMAGKKVYDLSTRVENRDAFVVTLKSPIKAKGSYLLKNILNNRFIETRKIVVE
jgi:hypothetical protein